MPNKLIISRYTQGLAAYRAGNGVAHLIDVGNEIEQRFDQLSDQFVSPLKVPDPEAREAMHAQREKLRAGEFGRDAFPSLVAGFADGLIADIRLLANAKRGLTA